MTWGSLGKPRLLDLFCCEGGASAGYAAAGFDVVGVDLVRHKRYPFAFVQAEAIAYVQKHGHEYDAIHASPPCQRHAIPLRAMGIGSGGDGDYPCHIEAVRQALIETGKPYVIENVMGAPLQGVKLCGTSFGLPVRRHRLFETSFLLMVPECNCKHAAGEFPSLVTGKTSAFVQVCGRARAAGEIALRRSAMRMPWASEYGLSQAIPPAYTQFIGERLLELHTLGAKQ